MPISSTRDAHMYYTSGTTGAPKGVTLSHAIVDDAAPAVAVTAEMRLCSHDVWLHAAPMFHLVDAFATTPANLPDVDFGRLS